MTDKVRLILIAKQQDLISRVKLALSRKPYIESILVVARPIEVENKLARHQINVLLWNLDEFRPEHSWAINLQKRFTFHILYTSVIGGRQISVPITGNDAFIQKPPVFTDTTSARYCASVENHMDSLVKRQRPPSMRDWAKMVENNGKQKIIAIGSSTGGTNALESILKAMPVDMPPMVVVQHMPSGFTKLFAERLNALYKQDVSEAQSGDFLMNGRLLIAPADRHLRLIRQQGKIAVECYVGNRIHGVMPAADILFESVAEVMKRDAVGVILTGMGSDGARGLLQMKNAGCVTIGQDEESCVVYGMPKAAKDIGAVDYELPLDKIPEMILHQAGR